MTFTKHLTHPPYVKLDDSPFRTQIEADPSIVCGELIAALESCHAKGLLHKWSGACNDDKHALTVCLRKEVGTIITRHFPRTSSEPVNQ